MLGHFKINWKDIRHHPYLVYVIVAEGFRVEIIHYEYEYGPVHTFIDDFWYGAISVP